MSALKDRVAIITGAPQGIGRTIAEGLAAEGAKVVVADLHAAEDVAQRLGGLAVQVGVSDQAACERMAQAALDAYGQIDILVNNAGIYSSLVPTPFEQLSVDEWRRVFDVNVLGMYLATCAVAPAMRTAKRGRVINLASGTPYTGVPFLLHYVASKGAVLAMTRSLAKELGGDNVLVNHRPGVHHVRRRPGQRHPARAAPGGLGHGPGARPPPVPRGHRRAVVFFAADASAFITGQSLVVDGGAYFN